MNKQTRTRLHRPPIGSPTIPPRAAIKTHADALLKLLEDSNASAADGGDTPGQKTAKAALRAKFVKYFIPADFVEDLRADRDAIDEKNKAKSAGNLEGVESIPRTSTPCSKKAARKSSTCKTSTPATPANSAPG